MRWRKIDEERVRDAAHNPDWTEPTKGGRVNRWKGVAPNRFLRVTCRDEGEATVVISVVYKRQAPQAWRVE